MNKQLREYEDFMKKAIDELKGSPATASLNIAALYEYHTDRVHEFQHERLVHLLVTLFFAGLLLLAICGYILLSLMSIAGMLGYLLGAVILLLFIVELFYIRYYYLLENGTQRLYFITKYLYEIRMKLK